MKIIRHGNQYEYGPVICPRCNCEFTYNLNDLKTEKIYEDGQFGKEEYEHKVVHCPECYATREIKHGGNSKCDMPV